MYALERQATDLMKDKEGRKGLEISDPIRSFEQLVMPRKDAVKDILKTATKTRKSVNEALGVDE